MKGRGARANLPNRFAHTVSEAADDGWYLEPDDDAPVKTEVHVELARSIVSTNRSPDLPFDQSINPYKGCEHGCVYCYARPSHEYLDLSLGLDFETQLYYKPDAPRLLTEFLERPGYRCRTIAIGVNTDAYQPLESKTRLTRQLLQVLERFRHPVSLITKSALILRDTDILERLAEANLVTVFVSITTLDDALKRIMEPRAAAPASRLRVVRTLGERGIPVGVMAAPVIPYINDAELEAILRASAEAGAEMAGYTLLRLPHQLRTLFGDWLEQHFPERAQRVLGVLAAARGGTLGGGDFGVRMTGEGAYAALIARRFELCRRRARLGSRRHLDLDTSRFRPPGAAHQLRLI